MIHSLHNHAWNYYFFLCKYVLCTYSRVLFMQIKISYGEPFMILRNSTNDRVAMGLSSICTFKSKLNSKEFNLRWRIILKIFLKSFKIHLLYPNNLERIKLYNIIFTISSSLSIYYAFKFNFEINPFYRIRPIIKHIVINPLYFSILLENIIDCTIFFFIHSNPSLLSHRCDYRSRCYDVSAWSIYTNRAQ